jgi:hypothetical protein
MEFQPWDGNQTDEHFFTLYTGILKVRYFLRKRNKSESRILEVK